MSISAQPYTGSNLQPLKPTFDLMGLSGPDPIEYGPFNSSAVQETEQLNFNPGARSLKARVLTLIENSRPNIALDIMQKTMNEDRDLFDSLYFDVKESLEDTGFERDAKELSLMASAPEVQEPDVDYQMIQNTLFLG